MVQDCPNCGLANPPSTISCDCGYNFQTQRAANVRGQPESLGVIGSIQLARLAVGGAIAALVGVGLMINELTEPEPSLWIILLAIAGAAAGGYLLWLAIASSNR